VTVRVDDAGHDGAAADFHDALRRSRRIPTRDPSRRHVIVSARRRPVRMESGTAPRQTTLHSTRRLRGEARIGERDGEVRGRTIMPASSTRTVTVGLVAGGRTAPTPTRRANVQPQLFSVPSATASLPCSRWGSIATWCTRFAMSSAACALRVIAVHGRAGCRRSRRAPPVPSAPDQVYRPKTAEEAVANVREASHPQAGLLQDLGG